MKLEIDNIVTCIEIVDDLPEDPEDGVSTATKASQELQALLDRIKELEDWLRATTPPE